MAKKRDWKKIRHEWETTKITFKALAEKHNVKEGTLKSRRSREKWSRDATDKKDATIKKDATKKKKADATGESASSNEGNKKETTSNTTKKNRRREQRNRSGNPNPKNQFTERNSAALKHGFFSRYMPKETLEIMGMIDKDNPVDLLWDQVMIQYAAIIRAQKIMFVTDINDTAKELKKLKIENVIDSKGDEVQVPIEKEYEVQFAWDRHANFMNAQSRASAEFRSSIKQFLELAPDNDERRLRLEKMQLDIDKTAAEIERINDDGSSDEAPIEIVIKKKGDDS